MDIAAYDRILMKVGLNLIANLFGLDLIRNPAFETLWSMHALL
jgi:hypothetical protein